MFAKKSQQDVKKSTVKIQDSKKDSATRLKHLKIVLDHFDTEEAKSYFEANYSHVYFILYDTFIQAENNLRQKELPFHLVHKAGREELDAALSLLEKVLCLLPELLAKRWQLHSLTRIFSKLLHTKNTLKLRAEAIRYFLLWYQALGDMAPPQVHKMFANLLPGLPSESTPRHSASVYKKHDHLAHLAESSEFNVDDIMKHPNFATKVDNAKNVIVEQTPSGIIEKLANVTSIFHSSTALNPVQCVEVQPILPASSSERPIQNETRYFLEILLNAMATTHTKLLWKDRSHNKCMRCFAFLLEKFKLYYLPIICPQFDYKNSLYKPNLELPVHPHIIEDEYVICRVAFIKWVAGFATFAKKPSIEGGQPSSIISTGSYHHPNSNTPTPSNSLHHEEETSFTVGLPSDSSRGSSHDSASTTPHQSLDTGSLIEEELDAEQIVRDVLCSGSREHVDFTIEVLRQAFLLPITQYDFVKTVISLYKEWMRLRPPYLPPFVLENAHEDQVAGGAGEPPVPPRRLRTDSYIGAISRDNVMVRAGLQNILQVAMTQAATVFAVTPPEHEKLQGEHIETCKQVLNMYRFMVMQVTMDDNTWEQLLLVLLHITSLVLTKRSPDKVQENQEALAFLVPPLFQTLIVTWIKANLHISVKAELWQSFMDLLSRLTHWEELINEWAKTMGTLTRMLAMHVYSLELNAINGNKARKNRGPRRPPQPLPAPENRTVRPTQVPDSRLPSKSPKLAIELRSHKEGIHVSRRSLTRCKSDLHLNKHSAIAQNSSGSIKESNTKAVATRRWVSMESLRPSSQQDERDLLSRSSPAPSSGIESNSIKDSHMDLASDAGNVEWAEDNINEDTRSPSGVVGVLMGGTAKGWLPDVAAVLWKRLLGALGDPNLMEDPTTHYKFFNHLIELNNSLLKISANQALNGNTEIHVPFNLVAGWCLEAETLPNTHRDGKLLALRLLCESTQAQRQVASSSSSRSQLAHLNLYQRALHHGLTGEDRSVVHVLVQYAAPRYISHAIDGYSLLLMDFTHACTVVLNSKELGESCPRTASVMFLGSLLTVPDALLQAPKLQPCLQEYKSISCPDLKEHVLNIIVRVCRRESSAAGRAAGACALAAHVTQLLATRTYAPRLPSYVTCLLHMLMMRNRSIAKIVSDAIQVLADYTDRIVEQYPGLAAKIIKWICACLAQLSSNSSQESAKTLASSLLPTLAEFAVRCGPTYLMEQREGKHSLLLIIFKVLHVFMSGSSGTEIEGLSLVVDEDFDPNIQLENLGPKPTPASTIDVKLWAQTICTQLVLFLGHWPLWSTCQLSSSVSEHHDSNPSLGTELNSAVLSAPHIQFLRLGDTTLLSLIQLPALDTGATIPGLVRSDQQVRLILRDLVGKSCWDAYALHYDPSYGTTDSPEPLHVPYSTDLPVENTLSSLPHPLPADLLPDYKNCPPDKHQLDHILSYIGHTSPEVSCGRRMTEVGPSPLPTGAEDALLAALVAQRNAERHYLANVQRDEEYQEICEPVKQSTASPFSLCRAWLAQTGAASASRRSHTHLLTRSDRLVRELKNLDSQRCRETHKVAVIYVARGQEARNEILSNRCGSPAYEAFLAALAWEVDLETHVGFAGGLRGGGGGGGVSAPYFATLTLEALFHVSTRMPADTPDAILIKTRHLGNDEVHVVWSEHWREYRRDTLPTQFCDVLICLYPLRSGLLRCTVSRRPTVPRFGPVWEECVLPLQSAATLVRGAAVCGGRSVRATLPLYQHAYAERARSLQAALVHHAQPSTFEQYLHALRDPLAESPNFAQQQDQSSGRLAAALLDHGSNSWSGNNETHTISPRPMKRIGGFKRPPASPPVPVALPRKNR